MSNCMGEHSGDAMVEDLQERISTLEAALRGLVDRLDVIHADPKYRAVWEIYMIHQGPYSGPQYGDELEIARKALKGDK